MTSINITDYNGFYLKRLSSRASAYLSTQLQDNCHITASQWGLLLLLNQYLDGLTVAEIQAKLNIRVSSASGIIKRLERSKFIYRVTDKDDSRVRRIYISKAGMAMLPKATVIAQKFDALMFDGFSYVDKEKFGELINRVYMNIRDLN